jgi:hypothetical protein
MLPQGSFNESGQVQLGRISPQALLTINDLTCDRCDRPFFVGEEVRGVRFEDGDLVFVEHESHPVCKALLNVRAYCATHELVPDASTDECHGYEVTWAGSRNGTTH